MQRNVVVGLLEALDPGQPQATVGGQVRRARPHVVAADGLLILIEGLVQGAGDQFLGQRLLGTDGPEFLQFGLQVSHPTLDHPLRAADGLGMEVRVGGDEIQGREAVPVHLEHLGIVGHRVVDAKSRRRGQVGDPPLAPGDLLGIGEGQGGPDILPDKPAVLVIEFPDPGEAALSLPFVCSQVESVLAFLPIFPGLPAEVGSIASLGVRSEVTVAAGHGGGLGA